MTEDITIDREHNVMYWKVQEGKHHETLEVGNLLIDVDKDNNILGVEQL